MESEITSYWQDWRYHSSKFPQETNHNQCYLLIIALLICILQCNS